MSERDLVKVEEKKDSGALHNPALGEEYFAIPGQSAQERIQSSKEQENAAFAELGKQINKIQKESATAGADLERGFHAKGQGCLIGELKIYDDETFRKRMEEENGERIKDENIDVDALRERTKHGLFKEPNTYNILARYSNGVGVSRPDYRLDVRGLAFKVLGHSDGSALPPGGSSTGTHDFLMTNMPVPMGKDAYEFMQFAQFNHQLREKPLSAILDLPGFAAKHPEVAKSVLRLVKEHAVVPSLARETFWGGSPYRLGSEEQGSQAIKFLAKPVENSLPGRPLRLPETAFDPANYLRNDLQARIAQDDIKYNFYVQFQTDPLKTPIEDANKEWKESDSIPVPIGELKLIKGQEFNTPERQKFCESMVISPAHYTPGHKPLGNLNRGRETVYRHSSALRVNGDSNKAVKDTNIQEVEKVFGPFPGK